MILVTVGTQKSFDRLIRLVDSWASYKTLPPIYAQIGNGGDYIPSMFPYHPFLPKSRLEELTQQATLIISHAGMGSILTARQHRKPILVVPRREDLNEHRNNHQCDTARSLEDTPGLYVCWNDKDFDNIAESALYAPRDLFNHQYSTQLGTLINKLKNWANAT
ncbi:glycosyltransferase [Cupriavidus sp. IDO]|uniref:glycosyltransferase n=1 Tax=Cupriavidus sp. IDO TaxID=1539142 RepID=UPI0009E51B32|nr:glycosyltransferase [Cupriavidus sp. IDO]